MTINNTISIPKIIHFVWVSNHDNIHMPMNGLQNVGKWTRENPDFTSVILAAGKDITVTQNQELLSSYQEALQKVRIPEFGKTEDEGDTTPLTKEEISRIQIVMMGNLFESEEAKAPFIKNIIDIIQYAASKLRPNYGMVSDLMRYLALFIRGGAYFDCTDVTPGTFSLQDFYAIVYPNGICEKHVLYGDHLSSKPFADVSAKQLGTFRLGGATDKVCFSNDSLISTRHNPLLLLFCQEALRQIKLPE